MKKRMCCDGRGNRQNSDYWSIVKGIGAILVVFGHCCGNFPLAKDYVYLFHLAIFFFTAGYLWNEKKYGDHPEFTLASRIRNSYPRYLLTAVILVFLHNWFVDVGIIIGQPRFSIDNVIISIIISSVFCCTEVLASSLWFVPLSILGITLFSTIVALSRKLISNVNRGKNVCKYTLIVLLSIVSGIVGVYATKRCWVFDYNLQIVFLVIPIYAGAYLTRVITKNHIERYCKWFIAFPISLFLWRGMSDYGWRVELSRNCIPGGGMFFIISFSGIYVCLCLAERIMKNSYSRSLFSFIGRHSFEVMAWHLLIVKVVDIVYGRIIGEQNKELYGSFASAYPELLWPIYLLLGVLIPVIVSSGIEKAILKCEGRRSTFTEKANEV